MNICEISGKQKHVRMKVIKQTTQTNAKIKATIC